MYRIFMKKIPKHRKTQKKTEETKRQIIHMTNTNQYCKDGSSPQINPCI